MVENRILRTIESNDFLKGWGRDRVARLIPHMEWVSCSKGSEIFRPGMMASSFYFVDEGTISEQLPSGVSKEVADRVFGEEALLGAETYLATATAETESSLFKIDAKVIRNFAPKDLLHKRSLDWVHNRDVGLNSEKSKTSIAAPQPTSAWKSELSKVIGWLFAIIVPTLILIYGPHYGSRLDPLTQFIAAFSATVVMWVFNLVPAYVAGLFTLLFVLAVGTVEPEVALSGFASGSFFMAMSIFALGSVLMRSGCVYRGVLVIMRYCPATSFCYSLCLMGAGMVLTPLLPSANGRVALTTPLLKDLFEGLNLTRKGRQSTRFAALLFSGVTVFSSCFLTSKSLNLLLFGMLPTQRQDEFQWLKWAAASLPAIIVLGVGLIIVSSFIFASKDQIKLKKENVSLQLRVLGPLTRDEWIAIGAVVFFILAILTASIHMVRPPWVALGIFYSLLSLGVMGKSEVKSGIDWSFLLLLGSMIGLVAIMDEVGLHGHLGAMLSPIGDLMSSNFYLFLLVFVGLVFAVRMVLPINAAGVLLATIFIPLAEAQGVHSWIIIFSILTLVECWFMPYQASFAVVFEGLTGTPDMYNKSSFAKFNIASILLRIVALFATVYTFSLLGML